MNILFIAEATTGKNKQFSNANNLLFRTIKQAFEEQCGPFISDESFFAFLSEKGIGLEHLCVKTITKESAAKRAEARQRCIPSLSARIKKERPQMIIILMKNISEEIDKAVVLSETNTVRMIRAVSYPALSERHRLDCIAGIKSGLAEAAEGGIISLQKDFVGGNGGLANS